MGAQKPEFDDDRVLGVTERDQLVPLIGEGRARLAVVPLDFGRAVVDVAGGDDLVAGMADYER